MAIANRTGNGYKVVPSRVDRNEFLVPFDSLFDSLFSTHFPELTKECGVGFFEKQSYPRVDIIDYEDKVEILAEIPGLSKEEVTVEVQDDVLTISGHKTKKTIDDQNDNRYYIRKELKHSSFKRSFTLSEIIDKTEPVAKFENGLLSITLKKVTKTVPQSRKITIE